MLAPWALSERGCALQPSRECGCPAFDIGAAPPSQVNLGSEFYVTSKVEDPSRVVVNLGPACGVHLEMSLTEAIAFAEAKDAQLSSVAERAHAAVSVVRADVERVLSSLSRPQQAS